MTGASSGLGRSLVKESVQRGNQVFAAARSLDKLQSLASEHPSGQVIPIETDVSDPESIQNLFRIIDRLSKKIDVVINNAAVGHNKPIAEMSDPEMNKIVLTNLLGTMMVAKEAINRMMRQGNGQVAFVSSLAGKLAFPNLGIYSATKFGIEGFAEAAREELKGTNVGITVIRPGIMDTNFFENAGMSEFAKDAKNRMQTPQDVAQQALQAIEQNKCEITIGTDKRFLPFLKHLPSALARKLLPYIT